MQLDQSDFDDSVTWTLSRAARAVERKMSAIILSHGLSAVQFGIMVQLSANDSMTRAELARATMVRPQSMAGVIDGMIDQRMLELTGTGGKGRPNPVRLTESGRAIIEAVWPPFVEANRAIHLGLSDAEASQLNATLHRLIEL